MARETTPIEVNKFTGGLFTDSTPLTSPDGYSLDEMNMSLNVDGSIRRRLGMDFEEDFEYIPTGRTGATDANTSTSTFTWRNAGGDPEKVILVVQTGHILQFFDLDTVPISTGPIDSYTFDVSYAASDLSYAVVDGFLVIANGSPNPIYLQYNGVDIDTAPLTLKVRDFFGVETIVDTIDMASNQGIQIRPPYSAFPDLEEYLYNLRNQSWAIPRVNGDGWDGVSYDDGEPVLTTPDPMDPITIFWQDSSGLLPSFSDNVGYALYANPENKSNRTIERFFSEDLIKNPLGTSKSASGFFVIDVLNRGVSRLQEIVNLYDNYPTLSWPIADLPEDATPGGPSVLAEFAGRMWYGGFSGEVTDGDNNSPRLSSYILFSQVVNSGADIANCYQVADPTSKDNPDIVDTDGGYIRLNGAYGIKRMINLGDSLMIVAKNGVWRIVGGTEKGFTATNYIVEKVSSRGCTNQGSIAIVDTSLMFWGEDGIYHLHTDQFGSWVADNISFGRIQNLFDDLTDEQKRLVKGSYDNFERKVRWLYNNGISATGSTYELVLDTTLKSFSRNQIDRVGANYLHPLMMYTGLPYDIDGSQREIGYIAVWGLAPSLYYTFATYRDRTFYDFKSFNGVGVDAPAYTVAGYISNGDFQRDKQAPFITVYLAKTETGFTVDGDDFAPVNPSSCMVQAQWEWTNSANSGKWGRPFQAYRHRRMYMPVDVDDTYDDGNRVVVSKSKLRGNGRVLSIKFYTEPGKDLHLYGWSLIFSVAGHV